MYASKREGGEGDIENVRHKMITQVRHIGENINIIEIAYFRPAEREEIPPADSPRPALPSSDTYKSRYVGYDFLPWHHVLSYEQNSSNQDRC